MRTDLSQLSFADVEFLRQGVRLDPLLEKISGFIDKHPELAEAVRCDLELYLKNQKTVSSGLSAKNLLSRQCCRYIALHCPYSLQLTAVGCSPCPSAAR